MEATLLGVPHWKSSNVSSATLGCEVDEEGGASSTLIGVIMGLTASIGINSGQNLQALGLQISEEVRLKPYTSRTWCIGMAVFITGSMLNFAAFSFAASSILVPLEAVQFVTNVGFNRFVNKKTIPTRMLVGVFLAVSGVTLSVVFGSTDVRCFTIDQLIGFWEVPLWWIYLIFTLLVSLGAYLVHRKYSAAEKAGRPLANSIYVLPVTFAVAWSLVGGANMIVHSKAVAELLELQTSGVLIFSSWYFYLEATLLSVTGCIWLFKMNESLGLYDPLFIIPLLQSSYILFGVISGGIFFQSPTRPDDKADPAEVRHLHPHDISMEVVLENPLVEDPNLESERNTIHLTNVHPGVLRARSASFPSASFPQITSKRRQSASKTLQMQRLSTTSLDTNTFVPRSSTRQKKTNTNRESKRDRERGEGQSLRAELYKYVASGVFS
ncbi:MAG: hypothetical protein SGPRY_006084 [Prymnesium sp.]